MTTVAKKHYSLSEIYSITLAAARTRRFLADSYAGRDKQFAERIILAVTEVNGCALCSYGHARVALRAGLADDEVRDLLGGLTHGAPDDQLPAIAFAQHYADTRGHPDGAAWEALVEAYGEDEALGVLATVRTIMWGNAVGIPLSSLGSRLRGSADPGSSLRYELTTVVGSALLSPLALAHALLRRTRDPVLPATPAVSSPSMTGADPTSN